MPNSNVLNPNIWHNCTLNQLNIVSSSKENWFSRTPKLLSLNILAIGTGTTAAFSQLLKFSLFQPPGILLKGSLGVVRIGWKDFAQKTYESLPGPIDWAISAKKVALLIVGTLISLLAAVGSLISAKPSAMNVSFNHAGGVYETDEERTFRKLSITTIHTQADVAKTEAVRLEKSILSSKKQAQDALSKATSVPFDQINSLIKQAEEALKNSAQDAKKAHSHAAFLETAVKQAEMKLKEKKADQATVDAIKEFSKETKKASEGAQKEAEAAKKAAEETLRICQERKINIETAKNSLQLSEQLKDQIPSLEAFFLSQKNIAEAALANVQSDKSKLPSAFIVATRVLQENEAKINPFKLIAECFDKELKYPVDRLLYERIEAGIKQNLQSISVASKQVSLYFQQSQFAAEKILAFKKVAEISETPQELKDATQKSYDSLQKLPQEASAIVEEIKTAKTAAFNDAEAQLSIEPHLLKINSCSDRLNLILTHCERIGDEIKKQAEKAKIKHLAEQMSKQDFEEIEHIFEKSKNTKSAVQWSESDLSYWISEVENLQKNIEDAKELDPIEIKKETFLAKEAIEKLHEALQQDIKECREADKKIGWSRDFDLIKDNYKLAVIANKNAHEKGIQLDIAYVQFDELINKMNILVKAYKISNNVLNAVTETKTAAIDYNEALTINQNLVDNLKELYRDTLLKKEESIQAYLNQVIADWENDPQYFDFYSLEVAERMTKEIQAEAESFLTFKDLEKKSVKEMIAPISKKFTEVRNRILTELKQKGEERFAEVKKIEEKASLDLQVYKEKIAGANRAIEAIPVAANITDAEKLKKEVVVLQDSLEDPIYVSLTSLDELFNDYSIHNWSLSRADQINLNLSFGKFSDFMMKVEKLITNFELIQKVTQKLCDAASQAYYNRLYK